MPTDLRSLLLQADNIKLEAISRLQNLQPLCLQTIEREDLLFKINEISLFFESEKKELINENKQTIKMTLKNGAKEAYKPLHKASHKGLYNEENLPTADMQNFMTKIKESLHEMPQEF